MIILFNYCKNSFTNLIHVNMQGQESNILQNIELFVLKTDKDDGDFILSSIVF